MISEEFATLTIWLADVARTDTRNINRAPDPVAAGSVQTDPPVEFKRITFPS